MSDSAHDSHTGPVKTPMQLLWLSLFAFVVPVFVIIGLVHFVTAKEKPAAGAVEMEQALAKRIQRVGTVELRDANRPLQSGEAVFKAQCATCHEAGLAGAPKFGDAGAWAARIGQGYDALLNSALKGKGAMGAQGGGAFTDVEIGRAVVHMANAAGAKFPEPGPAAASAAAPNGKGLYEQSCATCHGAGLAGAPKFGDKAAWAPRASAGLETLVASAIKGKGGMPPKGGTSASDEEIKAAVSYMLDAAK